MGRLENLQVWGKKDSMKTRSSVQGSTALDARSKKTGQQPSLLGVLLAGAGCVGLLLSLVSLAWHRRQSLHRGFMQLGDPELVPARARLNSDLA